MAKVLTKEEQIINQHIDDLRERMRMLRKLKNITNKSLKLMNIAFQ